MSPRTGQVCQHLPPVSSQHLLEEITSPSLPQSVGSLHRYTTVKISSVLLCCTMKRYSTAVRSFQDFDLCLQVPSQSECV